MSDAEKAKEICAGCKTVLAKGEGVSTKLPGKDGTHIAIRICHACAKTLGISTK